jgi:hypothetical protein
MISSKPGFQLFFATWLWWILSPASESSAKTAATEAAATTAKLPPPNPLAPILPQPRLLSAFEAQPPGPQAPEWPLMPQRRSTSRRYRYHVVPRSWRLRNDLR